jgi:hypothetical protein
VQPYLNRHEHAEARQCIRNLSGIGTGTVIYAKEHGGKLPLGIADLVGDSFNELPVCPRAKRLGLTPQGGGAPGSFVYLRPADTFGAIPDPARTVMAYEPPAYHGNEGMKVLFCDGSTVWLDSAQAKYLLDELAAGYNPPRADPLDKR